MYQRLEVHLYHVIHLPKTEFGRQTGGGAGGRVETGFGGRGGSSGAGTSYSGGTGGGGTTRATAGNGSSVGGAGGNGGAYEAYIGGGGAGNPAGRGSSSAGNASNGTGGLLVIFADTFKNNSTISSNGSRRRKWILSRRFFSDGGSINIFYNRLEEKGQIVTEGGAAASNIPASGYQGQKGIVRRNWNSKFESG